MKKILFTAVLALQTAALQAEGTFPWLIITRADGSLTALDVTDLEITFSGGELVAQNATGQTRLTLAGLRAMEFSQTRPTEDGLTAVPTRRDGAVLCDVSGRQAQQRAAGARLRRGVYIVRKADGETSKIVVK